MSPPGAGSETAITSSSGGRVGERLAYSVAEAAIITGLSRDLLYDQMRVGKLAYLKVGRRRIITRQNLEAFLIDSAS
jgi:excisionase family DNA binding protein